MAKTCTRCGSAGPFAKDRSRKSGRTPWCKACLSKHQVDWRARNTERHRAWTKRWRLTSAGRASVDRSKVARRARTIAGYGLTPEAHAAMVDRQSGRCAICLVNPCDTIDHCHTTGRVRELLCRACNLAIGQFGDDPWRMMRAIEYVLRHSAP